MWKLLQLVSVVAVTLVVGTTATATIVNPLPERDLIISSRAIVVATVTLVDAQFLEPVGAVHTFVTLDVVEKLKGDVPPGQVVIEQVGGNTASAATLVPLAPRFEIGQTLLLFLNTDRRGVLRVAHLALGYYVIEQGNQAGGQTHGSWVRGPFENQPTRSMEFFSNEIRATLADDPEAVAAWDARFCGVPIRIAPPDYQPSAAPATPAYTFLPPGYRWFESDRHEHVPFSVNSRGGPTPSSGVDEAKAAFRAWSSIDGTGLSIEYAGETSAGGFRAEGLSVISYGDPYDQIDDPVDCSGVVALGGVTATTGESVTIGGMRFSAIDEADVVVNNGYECLLADPVVLREVLTHELGHAVGFGHSSENPNEANSRLRDATMFFLLHKDDRGASLRADDMEGARFLYDGEGPLDLLSSAVPDAVPGEYYAYRLRADGGVQPYTFSVVSGGLPAGITLAADGLLSGTPTNATNVTVGIGVADAGGNVRERNVTLRVTNSPAPFLDTASYEASKERLVLGGLRLAGTAVVVVNGRTVAPPLTVRYKPSKSRLVVKGTKSALNISGSSGNTVQVSNGGRASNVVAF
jgi:hypothetical protein